MEIRIIVARSPNNSVDPPWIVSAWDEWTIDENYEGFEKDLKEQEKEYGAGNIRVGVVHVTDGFLALLFKPLETRAVETPRHFKDPDGNGHCTHFNSERERAKKDGLVESWDLVTCEKCLSTRADP